MRAVRGGDRSRPAAIGPPTAETPGESIAASRAARCPGRGNICAVENATTSESDASSPARHRTGARVPAGSVRTSTRDEMERANPAEPSLEASTTIRRPRSPSSARKARTESSIVAEASIDASTTNKRRDAAFIAPPASSTRVIAA